MWKKLPTVANKVMFFKIWKKNCRYPCISQILTYPSGCSLMRNFFRLKLSFLTLAQEKELILVPVWNTRTPVCATARHRATPSWSWTKLNVKHGRILLILHHQKYFLVESVRVILTPNVNLKNNYYIYFHNIAQNFSLFWGSDSSPLSDNSAYLDTVHLDPVQLAAPGGLQ